MGREFELKYAATPQVLQEVAALWENWTQIAMQTTYFDTADGCLSSQKITLRSRMENGVCVCTIKTPVSGYGRGEWDVQAPWNAQAAEYLFAAAGLKSISFEDLSPVCGARFTRLAKTVELPGCAVEIALDQGILTGGDREIPLYELEVELKSGSEAASVTWAEHFAARFGLHPEQKSKFRRALMLAKGEYHG